VPLDAQEQTQKLYAKIVPRKRLLALNAASFANVNGSDFGEFDR
jgi:hypothetical protein